MATVSPRPQPSPENPQAAIERLAPWFHNLHLPDGTQTAPDHPFGDFPAVMWAQLAEHLPADLSGWTALDIGCNAGFYTFQLAARGAEVTGIDVDPHYLAQARWAAERFGVDDRVTFRQMQVYDLAHVDQTFDLVLFLGVFYHLRYPMLGLDAVARRVGRKMVFQTLSMPGEEVREDTWEQGDLKQREVLRDPGWPKMAFLEHPFAGDPTNWWAPNRAGVEAMLRAAGMTNLRYIGREMYTCEPSGDIPVDGWLAPEFDAATGRSRRDPGD